MHKSPARLLRGVLLGLISGGVAFIIVLISLSVPLKIHAAALFTAAAFLAISDWHFQSLLSELSALLRRGTYSVWQLEQLDQTVPQLRKKISFAWVSSTWLKVVVGLMSGVLLWDDLSQNAYIISRFVGYSLLIYTIFIAAWARTNFRKLERKVDELTLKEASAQEKRRLRQELESGAPHDFSTDQLAQGYTKPATPICNHSTPKEA